MIGPTRTLVAAVAILTTLLTAGVVGIARGQAMAAGEIVICTGGGTITLAVDSGGNPTGPAHWCPDCVLTLLAGGPPAEAAGTMPGSLSRPAAAPLAACPGWQAPMAAQARAPPRA